MFGQEDLNKIKAFGALKYSVETMIRVLDLDSEEEVKFRRLIKDENSMEYEMYKRGELESTFSIHLGFLKKAQKGIASAKKEVDKIRRSSKY